MSHAKINISSNAILSTSYVNNYNAWGLQGETNEFTSKEIVKEYFEMRTVCTMYYDQFNNPVNWFRSICKDNGWLASMWLFGPSRETCMPQWQQRDFFSIAFVWGILKLFFQEKKLNYIFNENYMILWRFYQTIGRFVSLPIHCRSICAPRIKKISS